MKENYSIFLVDDDPDDHFLVKEVLKKINVACNLTSFYNGPDLLDLLLKKEKYNNNTSSGNPDLIILDLNMPLLNGFDTMEKIKSHVTLNSIPIYIMSTSQDPNDSKKALDMGASGFYGKPNSSGKLHQIIVEMLIAL
jgi:CheY-like chemotaxis protein